MRRHRIDSEQKVAGDADDERAHGLGSWLGIGLLCWRIVGRMEKGPASASAPAGKVSWEESQSQLTTGPDRTGHEINRGTARHGNRPTSDGIGVAAGLLGADQPPAADIGGDDTRCITVPSD